MDMQTALFWIDNAGRIIFYFINRLMDVVFDTFDFIQKFNRDMRPLLLCECQFIWCSDI